MSFLSEMKSIVRQVSTTKLAKELVAENKKKSDSFAMLQSMKTDGVWQAAVKREAHNGHTYVNFTLSQILNNEDKLYFIEYLKAEGFSVYYAGSRQLDAGEITIDWKD